MRTSTFRRRAAIVIITAVAVGSTGCSDTTAAPSFDHEADSTSVTSASAPTSAAPSFDHEAESTTVTGASAPITAATATNAAPRGFATLPPGSDLPSDADCAARVRPTDEVRPANEGYNHPPQGDISFSEPGYPMFARISGAFSGTTDEIIQWVACKWGIDEDVVRAQAAKESYWFQSSLGDFTSDPANCAPGHPVGGDGKQGECPESVGLLQVRYQYYKGAAAAAEASTAYNLDVAYAVWRSCFEGQETWLNTTDPGQPYEAGDLWGCVGRWFSGRWYTAPATEYIAGVQDYLQQRIWETSSFINESR